MITGYWTPHYTDAIDRMQKEEADRNKFIKRDDKVDKVDKSTHHKTDTIKY